MAEKTLNGFHTWNTDHELLILVQRSHILEIKSRTAQNLIPFLYLI